MSVDEIVELAALALAHKWGKEITEGKLTLEELEKRYGGES